MAHIEWHGGGLEFDTCIRGWVWRQSRQFRNLTHLVKWKELKADERLEPGDNVKPQHHECLHHLKCVYALFDTQLQVLLQVPLPFFPKHSDKLSHSCWQQPFTVTEGPWSRWPLHAGFGLSYNWHFTARAQSWLCPCEQKWNDTYGYF